MMKECEIYRPRTVDEVFEKVRLFGMGTGETVDTVENLLIP